jgi:hypothetical protein
MAVSVTKELRSAKDKLQGREAIGNEAKATDGSI